MSSEDLIGKAGRLKSDYVQYDTPQQAIQMSPNTQQQHLTGLSGKLQQSPSLPFSLQSSSSIGSVKPSVQDAVLDIEHRIANRTLKGVRIEHCDFSVAERSCIALCHKLEVDNAGHGGHMTALRARIKFPQPMSDSPPSILLVAAETGEYITKDQLQQLQQHIDHLAMLERHRPDCIVSCLRTIVDALTRGLRDYPMVHASDGQQRDQFVLDDSSPYNSRFSEHQGTMSAQHDANHSSSKSSAAMSSLSSTSRTRTAASSDNVLPCPRLSGARFSGTGILVHFNNLNQGSMDVLTCKSHQGKFPPRTYNDLKKCLIAADTKSKNNNWVKEHEQDFQPPSFHWRLASGTSNWIAGTESSTQAVENGGDYWGEGSPTPETSIHANSPNLHSASPLLGKDKFSIGRLNNLTLSRNKFDMAQLSEIDSHITSMRGNGYQLDAQVGISENIDALGASAVGVFSNSLDDQPFSMDPRIRRQQLQGREELLGTADPVLNIARDPSKTESSDSLTDGSRPFGTSQGRVDRQKRGVTEHPQSSAPIPIKGHANDAGVSLRDPDKAVAGSLRSTTSQGSGTGTDQAASHGKRSPKSSQQVPRHASIVPMISLVDLGDFFPHNRELAALYQLGTRSSRIISREVGNNTSGQRVDPNASDPQLALRLQVVYDACTANRAAAAKLKRSDLVQVWTLLALMSHPRVLNYEVESTRVDCSDGGPVSYHPSGQQLLKKMLDHYEHFRDVQTLGTVTSVLENLSDITRSCKGNISFGILSAYDQPKYNAYRYAYADLLYRWKLYPERNEVMKYINDPQYFLNSSQNLQFVTHCVECGAEPGRAVERCRLCNPIPSTNEESKSAVVLDGSRVPIVLNCGFCNTRSVGLVSFCMACGHGGHMHHMKKWFDIHTDCPVGCGCKCKEIQQ